jgi:hypothetical protein
MGSRPVKQSPILDRAENNMKGIGMGNFLGTDPRRLTEILNDDRELVHSLGLSHEAIARRLEEITEAAKEELGEVVKIEDRFEVRAEEARGKIPCPWAHPKGLFRKSHVELMDPKTGQALVWTDLSVHLIREHGFYQGRGSPYRLDPRTVKSVLFD